MVLIKISRPGSPDLHVHSDAVAEHERLGWTVLGEEEVEPPKAERARRGGRRASEDASEPAEGAPEDVGGEEEGVDEGAQP